MRGLQNQHFLWTKMGYAVTLFIILYSLLSLLRKVGMNSQSEVQKK